MSRCPISDANSKLISIRGFGRTESRTVLPDGIKAKPGELAGDLTTLVISFQLSVLINTVLRAWFFVNWVKWIFYVILTVVSYNCLIKSSTTNVVAYVILAHLGKFATSSNALEINAAVPVATLIKVIHSNLIWFLMYNVGDEYIAANGFGHSLFLRFSYRSSQCFSM